MPQTLNAEELEGLLAEAKTYHSVVVVRAAQITEDSEWTTAHGDPLNARVGDWWLTDSAGDGWSVDPEVFAATYEAVGNGEYRKTATVSAVRLRGPANIETLEGPATAAKGDWLVRNPSGECWPIPADVFEQRYRPVTEP